jgi:hypothetical protein
MMRGFIALFGLALFGAVRLPAEHAIAVSQQRFQFRAVEFNLGLREQVGQLGFVAALSGFRALVADVVFVQAHIAWERTEWGRVLLHFRRATMLQPRVVLFWDMAAWHMAWNASAAALNDPAQPRLTLRIKAHREYLRLGQDFLERGIMNNPDRPQLYEALGRLYRDKHNDHKRAAEYFGKAAALPGAPAYDKRFAAYELSYCPGSEKEAYDRLHRLYLASEKERVPTLVRRLKEMEIKLGIPQDERIPDNDG